VILLVASIPLVAQKKEKGWWIALVAALSILAIDIPAQFIRTTTLDYLYGALLALGLAASLLFPKFKVALISTTLDKVAPGDVPAHLLNLQTPSEAGYNADFVPVCHLFPVAFNTTLSRILTWCLDTRVISSSNSKRECV
jgi:hypothetical protein